MSSYSWLAVDTPDDYLKLAALLPADFAPAEIGPELGASISPAVRGLLIELDYVDKDYRSTYYHFYAKKGRPYRSDCVRLHLFDEMVNFDEGRSDLVCADKRPQDHYFGYIVLRPTLTGTIGRSILSPDVRQGARGQTIHANHAVHLLGHKLSIAGFPSMAQHADISVCAHVSCWAVLRHYSERFPEHRQLLIHDITMLAHPFDPGGLTPSLGLNVLQAERIFQAAGSYPLVVHKVKGEEESFLAQLLAYLESGFPLFVAMEDKSIAHAIVVVGHAWRDTTLPGPYPSSHALHQLDTLVAVDDNLLPYSCVPAKAKSPDYGYQDFSSFIVPLPEKVHYPADAVDLQSLTLYDLLARRMTMPPKQGLLRRYFITTLSALRRFSRQNESQFGDILVGILMRLQTSQFVWIVEYASEEQWRRGQIGARAILDATASLNDPFPVWMAHNLNDVIVFDRSSATPGADFLSLKRAQDAPMGRMEQNLRPVRVKS